MLKRSTASWGILSFFFFGTGLHLIFGKRLMKSTLAASSCFTESITHLPETVASIPPTPPAPISLKPQDIWPYTRNNVIFESTFPGGLGHKFGEVLVGVGYAEVFGLQFQFDRERFLANHRGVDLSWMADLIQERYPALPADASRDQFVYIQDVFSKPPTPSPEQQAKGPVTFKIDMQSPCGGRSCYDAGFSFWNAVPHLKDIFGMKLDSPRKNRIAVHLRFGDIEDHMTPEQYQRIIRNLRDGPDANGDGEEGQEETRQPEVHFVYSSGNPDEPILQQLRAEFPEAAFRDLSGVEEGLRYMAESSIIITSGSSYSVMAAYLCNGCRVIFAKPKEYKGEPMTEENYTKNYYYVQGWEPYFRLL